MPRKPQNIIGISPGTRYMGVAVFYGPELRDWGVKNMEGRWSKEKMKKSIAVISSLIGQHRSNVLAMKQLHPSRTSPNLNGLAGRIKGIARRKRMKIHQYSIEDIEGFFRPERRINRKELAEIVASEYPDLCHELNSEKAHRNPYHIRMFEAVALGSMCFRQLDNH